MDLKSIISITGKPGLHKVISQTKNGLIAESIEDGKRFPVYASEKVSTIEDISIYTTSEDVPLTDVYEKLFKKTEGKTAIDHKSKPEELKKFIKQVVDFDEERVYNSDLKKMIQWFNILVNAGLLKIEAEKKDKKDTEKDTDTKKVATKTTAKKTTQKKAAPIPKPSKAKGGTKTAMPSKRGA
ncbi:MAG: DUF5606 domain-containing protein [Vicingaceae bacterium]|nr:DUF5606 domain-containing protein [Vicingaceae bacterium]